MSRPSPGLRRKDRVRGRPPRTREAAARCFLRTSAATCMPVSGTTGSKPVASRSEAPRSCQGSLGSAGEWHTGQRRLPRCGAAATSDELLHLTCCPRCISRADGAAVQPRAAARQRPLSCPIPQRSAGRLQQQGTARPDRLTQRLGHVWRSKQLACLFSSSSLHLMCMLLWSVLQLRLAPAADSARSSTP